MIEPFIIEPTMMKDAGDCGICCLKMLLGCSYADVVAVIPKRYRRATSTGLGLGTLTRMARRLGHVLEYHDEDFNPDYNGILVVSRTTGEGSDHAVMWMGGTIYNPADGLLYTDLETFLTRGRWKVDGFLFRRRTL